MTKNNNFEPAEFGAAVLDTLFESDSPVGLAMLDRDLRYRRLNRAMAAFNGVPVDATRGRTVSEVRPQLDAELTPMLQRVLRGETLEWSRVVVGASGPASEWEVSYLPVRGPGDDVVGILAMARNVTSLQASRKALSASEARFRSLFDQAPEGMTLVDARGRMVLANRSMGELFACDPEQLVGQHVNMLLPEARRQTHTTEMGRYLQAPTKRVMAQRRQLSARRLDGSEFPVEVALNPIPGRDAPEILATIVDITDRLAAQAAMEASLKEKTLLLNEVNHRVKNNLQIVASLLDIQSRSVGGAAAWALRDSMSRVRVIALTHQMLYEGHNFAGLAFGPYLNSLAQLLRQTYGGGHSAIEVQVDVHHPDMVVDLQHAVPCALIVNELLTNAFKHAFDGRAAGTIAIAAGLSGDDAAFLQVCDDGIGLPEGFDPQTARTMGYQLIQMLSRQIGGQCGVVAGQGTCLRVTFPVVR